MTPMVALQMLDDLTGKISMTRVDHRRVEECFKVLRELVRKDEEIQAEEAQTEEKEDGI